MEQRSVVVRVASYLVAGAVGSAVVVGVGLASGTLVTKGEAQVRITEQRVSDLAHVCEVLGERQWLKRNADLKGLRGWAYDEVRERLATDVLEQLEIDQALVRDVTETCANRLYA